MEGDITMTTEEKIKYFSDVTIENASNNSAQIIDDYTASLNKIFEDHKVDATRQAKLQITLGKAQLEKDKNKDLSKEQLLLKKELNNKTIFWIFPNRYKNSITVVCIYSNINIL